MIRRLRNWLMGLGLRWSVQASRMRRAARALDNKKDPP